MTTDNTHVQRRTLQLLRPYRISLAVAALLGVLGAAASLCQPIVTGTVVGRIVGHNTVLNPFFLLVALFAAEGSLAAAQVYLLGRTGNSVVLDVRRSLVSRLMRAPMAAHFARQRGDLFSTAVADTSIMGSLLAQSLATLVTSSVMVLGSLAFMAYLDLVLTAVILGCVTVAGALTFAIARRLRVATLHNRDRVGDFGSALQRAVTDVRTVKVSRAEGREEDRIGDFARRSFDASMRATRLNALMAPAMGLGVQASFMAVFTVGAYRLASGQLTTGTFSAYLLYVLYLIAPLLNFFTGIAQFQQSVASATRVTAVVDDIEAESTRESSAHSTAQVRVPGSPLLSFKDVTYSYKPGAAVLNAMTFDIPERGLTAIVGPSGAGKSTIFGLIERFWDPSSGEITLDGRNIAALPLHELRARVGYVEQNAAVLDGTLRENLLYANPDATNDEVDEVLELTSLRDWVARLPQGLDTPMGESGTAISGGERQRIAIARMLLTKPELLLLDEATSQLDAESEAVLNATVRQIATRCAVVTIAHQISAAAPADLILVLEQGEIRARGSHASLLNSDQLYRRLAQAQQAPIQEDLAEQVLIEVGSRVA